MLATPEVTPKMAITFDEADVDLGALQAARKAGIKALIARGVTDLNTVPPDTWDYHTFVVLMVYHNRVAQRNFGYGLVSWAAHYQGVQIPFFNEAVQP